MSRLFRGAANTLIFLLALIAGCWGIRALLPFPDVPVVRQKVEHFARHHGDYDTLFIGSSRLYYQIIPRLFDELTAAADQPTRTFNAAVAGMRPPEDAYYLDLLLAPRPQRLRWVFIELAGIRTNFTADRAGTLRGVYWHDLTRMRVLLERALYLKPDRKRRGWWRDWKERFEPLSEFARHLHPWLQYELNLGRSSVLTDYLTAVRPSRGPVPSHYLGADLAGWVVTGRPEIMSEKERRDYEQSVAERRAKPAVNDPLEPVSQAALERMIAQVEAVGATAVLIVPPTTNKRNFVPTPERFRKSVVLDFCDLQKFPELFASENRLDPDHLNTAGAEIFTRLFVREWLEQRQRREAP